VRKIELPSSPSKDADDADYCNVKIGTGPVMQCQACGRGENGKHAEDCAWLRGEVKP
jgi:hypothetical protein